MASLQIISINNIYQSKGISIMSKPSVSSSFQNATGEIRYGMTNDYMFRAVFQENNGSP